MKYINLLIIVILSSSNSFSELSCDVSMVSKEREPQKILEFFNNAINDLEKDIENARSTLSLQAPERDSDYRGADFYLIQQSYLQSQAYARERLENVTSSKACYQYLIREFPNLIRYDKLISSLGDGRDIETIESTHQWRDFLNSKI